MSTSVWFASLGVGVFDSRRSAFQIVSNSSRLTLDFLLKVTSTTSRTTVEIDRLLFTSEDEDYGDSNEGNEALYAKTSTESGIVERSFSSSDAYDDVDVFADDLQGHQRVEAEKEELEEDLFE